MARKKLDNIERDVIAAMKLGYGVHYGAYKADHPYTAVEDEDVPALPATGGGTIACRQCGKIFSPALEGRSHNSRYCCQECYSAANLERARRYRKEGR